MRSIRNPLRSSPSTRLRAKRSRDPLARHRGWAPLLIALAGSGALGCSGNAGGKSDGGSCSGGDCADAGPQPFRGCTVTFSGDFAESAFVDGGCSSITPSTDAGTDAGPDWILQLQAFSSSLQAPMVVRLDLGPSPSPGMYSNDTVTLWSAETTSPAGPMTFCNFVAGSLAVSNGSFNATVTSVDGVASGQGTAHGTLSVQQYLEASAGTNCGTSNIEIVNFAF